MSEGQKELFGEIEPRAEATLPKGNGLQATGDGPLKELMDRNFLQYAAYVIRDRAIPTLTTG